MRISQIFMCLPSIIHYCNTALQLQISETKYNQ